MRALLHVLPLLPLLLLSVPLQAQNELLDRHKRQAIFERHVGLQASWLTAGPEERSRTMVLLSQLRGRGVPTIFAPRVELVTEAWHVLGGLQLAGEKTRIERRLADSLDLRVVPGVFGEESLAVGDSVRKLGEPLTVMVTWLTRVPVPPGLELALYWISPDGEETLARVEPFVAADFRAGFPMYVRAPKSKPSLWHLVPEIRTSIGAGRGFPVPVECVADLGSIVQPLDADSTEEERAHQILSIQYLQMISQGLRSPLWPGVTSYINRTAQESRADLLKIEGFDTGSYLLYGRLEGASAKPQRSLIVNSPRGVHPAWMWANPSGEIWNKIGAESDCRVFSTDLPLTAPEGGASVVGLANRLRELFPGEEVILMAQGPVQTALSMALAATGSEGLAIDRYILSSTLMPGREPRLATPHPVLFLEVMAPQDEQRTLVREDAAPLEWIQRQLHPFLLELDLPEILVPWLRSASPDAKDEKR